MNDCIFCKIVRGEIPSYTVYEDELVKAFFDITPVNEGHTLIIPKKHYANIFEIEDITIERIAAVAKKIAMKNKEVLGFDNCNLIQSNGKIANQDIFHFHMHVVPRTSQDGLNIWHGKKGVKPNFEELLKKLKIK